ncbi:MAG: glutathione S-transferase family protein [Gammaproteobacteria bacterium]|nr:glutathione S-transferase family protein [Gammaproteobacteria bacterium]
MGNQKQTKRDQLDFPVEKGAFVRWESQFRSWVTVDGDAGPTGMEGFKAEAGRYHLYVSDACPWAHRTLIYRKLKKLEDMISVSVVNPKMTEISWDFNEYPNATGDTLYGAKTLQEIYDKAAGKYDGVVTVPILWDKKKQIIVNNESSEIIRMLNSAFNHLTGDENDYYPQNLKNEIDEINAFVYDNINNGVYKTGFAKTQAAYEKAFDDLFYALDEIERRLANQRYLVGDTFTEADLRLFPTLIRFDSVYVGHFKCNLKRIDDYPNLSNYLREMYQMSGIGDTVNMDHIKTHYYWSHTSINPTRIVPKGPEIDYMKGHNRGNV